MYRICHIFSEKTDTDICELPPVYETVNPDALTAFLRCSDSFDTRPKRSVEFSYCGYRVMVDSTRQVTLHPESGSTDSIPGIRG
ncbi:HalOD1 output domain-containing protein [Haloarcula montana]|uniref:HalOD1 output domain-containing protein n=1 Tax=Haloarcula montana TaxID=3111776 RepID=UPI003DA8574B